MKFFEALKLSDIPIGTKKRVVVEGQELCLFHLSDGVFATTDICAHERASLSAGWIHDDGVVECPRHGARFDIRSGEVKALPATRPIPTYPVKIENETIFIGINENTD